MSLQRIVQQINDRRPRRHSAHHSATEVAASAHHEAGHAVIAHLGGITVVAAEVIVRHAPDGIEHTGGTALVVPRQPAGFVAAMYAGAVAEARWRQLAGQHPRLGGEHDRESAAAVCASRGWPPPDPAAAAREAEQRVAAAWGAITAVAAALEREQRLTGHQIAQIIRQARM